MYRCFVTAVCCLVFATSIYAQTAANIVPKIDPGSVNNRLTSRPKLPTVEDKVEITKPKPEKPEVTAAEQVHFFLRQINIEGVTVYSAEELLPLYQDKLNQEITLADLQAIANALTVKYRNAGYFLSRAIIPPQQIDEKGIVTLRVIEGFVASVQVEDGGKLFKRTKALLRRYAQHVTESKPLKLSVLERYTLLANDLPGIRVRAVLRPSATTPGAADLIFVAEQKWLHGYASIDNHASDLYGSEEVTLAGYANNILFAGSQMGARAIFSTHLGALNYYEINYAQALGTHGLKLYINVNKTETDPDFAAIDLSALNDITGDSEEVLTTLRYPLIRSRRQNLYLVGRFDYLDSRTDFAGISLFNDKIRSLRAGVSYDFADRHAGINVLTAEISQGLDILGAGGDPPTRQGADPTYTKINFTASRLQALPKQFSLDMRAAAQYAFEDLLSSEEFSYGGFNYGLGYDPNELTGDRGLEALLELRYDVYPAVHFLRDLQLFVYADAGVVWNINDDSQPNRQSGTSAGGGFRAWFTPFLDAELLLAKPLTREVADEKDKDLRAFFTVTVHL